MNVSIITVTLNCEETIQRTIESVLCQTYRSFEYIIQDGGSSDRTIDIIESYADVFKDRGLAFRCYIEKDQGIYDAMNRAVLKASGEWVNFMNSGDQFYSSETLALVFSASITPNSMVLYGNTITVLPWGEKLIRAKVLNEIRNRMIFCHQSSFTQTCLLRKFPFDLKYKICSDFHFFRKVYIEGKGFHYYNQVISIYDGDAGFSAQSSLDYLKEVGSIREFSQLRISIQIWIKKLELVIKKNLNEGIVLFLRRCKHDVLNSRLLS